ncbi:MAG: DUF1648 domain-containing protein [Gemmatimonadaceae bacterium]|jgi:hypothetical protein|nr:DUF1648 domain-containing protein [Gemmatimonadaceae bacterium]
MREHVAGATNGRAADTPITPLRIAGAVALVALFGFSIAVFGELPARIPQHFDASGTVTRDVGTSAASWFALPAVAAATWALVVWVGTRMPSNPELFNFPQKERFLALPASHRGPVFREMQRMLDATALLVVLIMGAVQLMVWQTAVSGSAGSLAQAPFVGIAAILAVSGVSMVRLARAVADAERRLHDARG